MLDDPAKQILARFPGPVTLKPARFWSVVLTVVPLLMLVAPLVEIGRGNVDMSWTLAGAFAVFVCFAAFNGAFLLPNAETLTLDREGFRVVLWFRKRRYLWKDVSAFQTQWTYRRVLVAFDWSGTSGGALAGVDRKLGFQNSLLPDDYGLGAEQLAALLNAWRERAFSARGISG